MGDFNVALVIVAAAVSVLVLLVSVYLLINYQHLDDANQAYFPTLIVVLGITVVVHVALSAKSYSALAPSTTTSSNWHGLGSMLSAEAMCLFVKILEEEDPGWYSRVPEFNPEPVVGIEMHKPKEEPNIVSASTNGTSIPEPKTISENGSTVETQDKVVILEGLSTVSAHEEWTPLSVSGQRLKPRYENGATVLQDKMYIFGGNHNGRYLSDLQLTSVGDVLKVDEIVKALVIKSTARDMIALSIKDLESNPRLFLSNKQMVFSEAEEHKDTSAKFWRRLNCMN